MKTLDQNATYTLALDHIKRGEYWLELIDRATGKVKILVSARPDMFKGMTIDHALRWMDKQDWRPMYKAGVL